MRKSPILRSERLQRFPLFFPDTSLQVLGDQVRSRGGPLTFLHHADTQALLETAVLATVASPLVHGTVFTGQTHVLGVFLHGALRRAQTNNQPPSTINHLIFDWFNLISLFPPSLSLLSPSKNESRSSQVRF